MSAPISKNPPPLPAGMDNPWYDYVPYPKRPKLNWPRNARVAFYVVLHLEYYELLPPDGIVKDSRFTGEFGVYHPDYRTWTQREYGNRTGIFRVLDVLDRYQIRAGVAVNAMAAERYPFLMEQFKKRNYEIIGHGVSANRMISSKMSEAEEKQEIATSIAALEKATGAAPKGWLGQEYGESQRTPKLLADAGIDYVLDWPNDDQPYPMHVGEGPKFVSLPNQPEWDDVQQLWLRRINTRALSRHRGRRVRAAAPRGRPGVQPVDPSLADGHGRIASRYLDEALRRIERFGNVWQATPGDVAKHYRGHDDGLSREQVLARYARGVRRRLPPGNPEAGHDRADVLRHPRHGRRHRGRRGRAEMQALTAKLTVSPVGDAAVMGTGKTAVSAAAAFLNGTAGTFLEMDEGNRFAKGHPSIHALPAVWAMAEIKGLSGKAAMEALILGYEVGARIGIAAAMRPDMHPHGTWGTVGAAAAVAKLLGYDAAQIRETINVASSLTLASSKRTMLEGGTVRNAYAGISNRMALMAIDLIEAGFIGERDGLSSVFGKVVSERFDTARMIDGLGRDWQIDQNYFKLHSCCRYNHGALDALDILLAKEAVAADTVERDGRRELSLRRRARRSGAAQHAGRQVLRALRGGHAPRARLLAGRELHLGRPPRRAGLGPGQARVRCRGQGDDREAAAVPAGAHRRPAARRPHAHLCRRGQSRRRPGSLFAGRTHRQVFLADGTNVASGRCR